MINRTSFIIDGFNLYHSVRQASHDLGLGEKGTKWLDIRALCSSYLHVIGGAAQLATVYYFSALATHLEDAKPDVTAKLLELFATDECDSAVLVTGDTDVAPAVRTAARLFPKKRVCFAFPYRRKNKELAQLVKTCFHITKEAYAKYQLPDPVVLPGDTHLNKPAAW